MTQVILVQSFLKAASRLKRQKGSVFDFLEKIFSDPSQPGLNIKKLAGTPSGLYSARVDTNVRVILKQERGVFYLLHVNTHDEAHRWASHQRVEINPDSQVVRITLVTEAAEQVIQQAPASSPEATPLLVHINDDELISQGIPSDWLPMVRRIFHEEQLYLGWERYPDFKDVWERLRMLASGDLVPPHSPKIEPISNEWIVDAPEEGWNIPFEEWKRFLHPRQMELVTGEFSGPVKVTGAAGTGKTLIGIHRAVVLAKQGQRVLLTTFTTSSAQNMIRQLDHIAPEELVKNVEVIHLHSLAAKILKSANRPSRVCQQSDQTRILHEQFESPSEGFPQGFLRAEWDSVISRQAIKSIEEYKSSDRFGRKKALQQTLRQKAWMVFEKTLDAFHPFGYPSYSFSCRAAREQLDKSNVDFIYDAVIADEVQDFGAPEIRLLAKLASTNPAGLMLLGDAGQRIYPGGYSLKTLGIDVAKGHSKQLRVSYRIGAAIRRVAERIRSETNDDLEGATEANVGDYSLRGGKEPQFKAFVTKSQKQSFVVEEIQQMLSEDYSLSEIAILGRTKKDFKNWEELLQSNAIDVADTKEREGVSIITMHSAKGLEFRAVFIVDCEWNQMPLTNAIAGLKDSDLTEATERERQLLYVALTRARERVYLVWVGRPSSFLEPLLEAT